METDNPKFSAEDAFKITHAFLDSEDSLTINKRLFRFCGTCAAVVLSDLFAKERRLLKMEKLCDDGLFSVPASDRQLDTGMHRNTYLRHLNELEENGVVSTKRVGVPSKMHYKINHPHLAELLMGESVDLPQSHNPCATSRTKKVENDESTPVNSSAPTPPYIREKRKETKKQKNQKKDNPDHRDKERRVRARVRPCAGVGHSEEDGVSGKIPVFTKWTKDENWLACFTKEFISNQTFVDTWLKWIAYRKHTGHSLHRLPTAGPDQAKDLMKVSIEVAVAALENSMKNGWIGVFPKVPHKSDGFNLTGKSNGSAVPKVDWMNYDTKSDKFPQWKKDTEDRALEMWKTLAKGVEITPEIKAEIIYFAHRCMVFAECEAADEYRYHYGTGVRTIKIFEKFITEHDHFRTFTFTNFVSLRYGGKIWEAFLRYKSGTLGQNVMTGKRV